MTNSIDVSVIMASYNNEDTILEAINSILSQSFQNFEFLIVNDGSNDLTSVKLKEVSDPRVKIINNKENIGLTRSLNKAIDLSTGRFIARQDADDISMPERLGQQYNYMQNNPDVALLGTGRATIDKNGKKLFARMGQKETDYTDLLKRNCFVHGSVMIRKKVLDVVGKYHEDFELTQDYELWLRISKRYRATNLQEVLYSVRRHEHRVTLSRLNEALLYRLLAVNMSLGKVSKEVMNHIHKEGIEAYYDHLEMGDTMTYHHRAYIKAKRYNLYDKAEEHLIKLIKLSPSSLALKTNLISLRLKKAVRSGL